MIRRVRYESMRLIEGPLLLKLQSFLIKRQKKKPDKYPELGPPLKTEERLREMISMHYLTGRYADGAVPVAWATSGAPVEILRPLKYHVVYPENHAALCGARHMAMPLLELAESQGYSPDICGYARCDFGTAFGGRTPAGRIPRPDLLVACTNICQTVFFWYRELAKHFKVPLVLIDTPFLYGEPLPHQLSYIEAQLRTLADVASDVTRRPYDLESLIRSTILGMEGSLLWKQCLEVNKAKPAPWSAFDQFVHMAVIVALRGTEECNSYYRELLDELKDRAKRGIGGIANERHRLLWDNLPVWFKLRSLSGRLASQGFHLMASTYTNAWAETADLLNETDPWRGMAKAYSHIYLNRDLPNKLRVMSNLVKFYECDGVILHSDRSCKPYSLGQISLSEKVAQSCGARTMLLEADHIDSRAWAEGAVDTRLQAFMESFK